MRYQNLFGGEELFERIVLPQQVSQDEQRQKAKNRAAYRLRNSKANLLHISSKVKVTGNYNMPILQPYRGVVPERFVPFVQCSKAKDKENSAVHFYLNDPQFLCIQNNPDKYIDILNQFRCVIGLDYSQYIDMHFATRMYNNYLNKVISAYLQNCGVDVVPNVTWSLPDSYTYCFDGYPKHSIIAINSTAIKSNHASIYFWRQGYERAIDILEPTMILRYGDKIPGEYEEISVYYENEHLNRMRYGK